AAHHPVLAPWHAFAALGTEFATGAAAVSETLAHPEPGRSLNPVVAAAFAGPPPGSIDEVAWRYAQLFAGAEAAGSDADPASAERRAARHGGASPLDIPSGQVERYFDRALRNQLRELRKKVDAWKVTGPGAPPRAMSLVEADSPVDPVIFVRGNPGNR